MATVILGVTGAVIGGATTGWNPKAMQAGWAIGTLVGAGIEGSQSATQNLNRVEDLRISGSAFGTPIVMVHGSHKVSGNIIWASGLRETSHKTGVRLMGTRRRTFQYHIDLAVAWCRGPVTRVKKIQADDITIYDGAVVSDPAGPYTIRNYLGTEWQDRDSLIAAWTAAKDPPQQTPAYRGTCYTLLENLNLEPWGNRVPNLVAEIEVGYSSLVYLDEPLIYYRFEDLDPLGDVGGKLADHGSKGYDLTDTGGTSTQVTGRHGEGIIVIAPVSLQRTVGQVSEFQNGTVTVEAWFRYKGGAPVNLGGELLYENPDTIEYPWSLFITPNLITDHVHIRFRVRTLAAGPTEVFNGSTGYQMDRDEDWHHVAVTYNQTGNAILYVDGVAVMTVAAPVNPMVITSGANNRLFFNGNDIYWDEVAVYGTILDAETIQARQSATLEVRHVMADVFRQVGLTNEQWELSEADEPVEGHIISTRTEARGVLQPLSVAAFVDIIEVDGIIRAKARGSAPVVTISADDLGCVVWQGAGTEPETLVSMRRTQDFELPLRVDVTYFNAEKDYEQDTDTAIRYTKGNVDNLVTVQTPLVIGKDTARQLAERLLYDTWISREQYQFSLPWTYSYLAPGDVVNLPVGSSTRRVRITQITSGLLAGPLQFIAVLDDAGVLTQVAEGAAVEPNVDQAIADVTVLTAWSNNAIVNEDADAVGYNVAAGGAGADYWPGALLFQSNDGGASYQEVGPLDAPAVLGTADTVLAAGVTTGLFDDVNTVDVEITSGSIETVSDAELLAGENLCLLGREYIGVGTVTPLGGGVFRLSHLLRGRRGTDHWWGTHQIGEAFALLEDGLYTRVPRDASLLGKQILLKAVTVGSTLADTTAVPVYVTGRELWPWSPVNVTGSRDGSDNLTVVWQRRDRKPLNVFSPTAQPMSETVESYTVEILSGVPKTITAVTQALQAVVTSAAHGFSVGQDVYLSGIVGMVELNGRIAEITAADTNTFTLDIDTRYFTAYASGGEAERILRSISASSETAGYLASEQSSDGLTPGAPVSLILYQIGALGRGYPVEATV